jgi:hypothetical protein
MLPKKVILAPAVPKKSSVPLFTILPGEGVVADTPTVKVCVVKVPIPALKFPPVLIYTD